MSIAVLEILSMLYLGMPIKDRRERERAARRRLIITTARQLAEAEGWDAVTTRRLSTEIEYSQPVLYKHFTGMEQIADAVAIDGFAELADVCSAASSGAGTASDALTRVAHAYLDFARDNPAVYDAMFTRATTLRFAAQDTPPQLEAAFAELRQAVGLVADEQDADALTEVLWAALHGLVTLSRAGRLRPGYDSERLQLLVNQFTSRRETMR
jgi:AcrR family transcriptional regulator